MSRTFHRRAPKQPSGPPPSVVPTLVEVTALLVELSVLEVNEAVLQAKLKDTFGSVQKGYGSIIALRNALRSAKQTIGG